VVNLIKQKGNGLKIPKIHQLQHFVEQIYDFGCASNVSGRIGESHLKDRRKQLECNLMTLNIGLQ